MRPRTDRPTSSIKVSPYLPWAIASGGLLLCGGLLESAFAESHGVGLETLAEHSDVPLTTPLLFLTAALLCGAWPAFLATWRAIVRRQLTWHYLVVLALVVPFSFGHVFEAAAAAFVFSLGLTAATHLAANRRSKGEKSSHEGKDRGM
jgi:cation transport ATPase